jgi:hypothetical protein
MVSDNESQRTAFKDLEIKCRVSLAIEYQNKQKTSIGNDNGFINPH